MTKKGAFRQDDAGKPAPDTAFVDPAGLPFITVKGPSLAGGAAAHIYSFLGIRKDPEFPAPVKDAIKEPLQAKFHSYGEKHCIHVVGPDFRTFSEWKFQDCFPGESAHTMPAEDILSCLQVCEERGFGAFSVQKGTVFFKSQSAQECYSALEDADSGTLYLYQDRNVTRAQAVEELAKAYENILREFAASELPKLRMLPVSGGIFSGDFLPELPQLTAESLKLGFSNLEPSQKEQVLKASNIDLCIFMEDELADFKEALDKMG